MLLGDANGRLGKREIARQRFNKAMEYEPARGRGQEAIALSYQAEGLFKEAQEAFEKALSLEPDNPDFVLNLGIHWHQFVKNPRKALPYYLKYRELGGKDPRVAAWIDECGGTPPL
jgi:Tfp pilus assembly protein PilF